MAKARFWDCIFCGGPNGSREHTTLASLGGLRTNREILCAACNEEFSFLDASLASDMRPLNAIVGVHHGTTHLPIETVATDPVSNRELRFSGGSKVAQPEATVIADQTVDGIRNVRALCSTQYQADHFLRKMKAEGKPTTLLSRERVDSFFTTPLSIRFEFGGDQTFRAVARVALNVLADHFPELVRADWITAFKNFVRFGENADSWAWFEASEDLETLPPETFAFAHRFIVGSKDDAVYARVLLLGVVEVVVSFGIRPNTPDFTLVHDVDVLATARPNDVRSQGFAVALMPPAARALDPSIVTNRRIERLLHKHRQKEWDEDAPLLVSSLNAATSLPASERRAHIVKCLKGQEQRILHVAVGVARRLRAHLINDCGEDAVVADEMLALLEPDPVDGTGLRITSRANLRTLVDCLAEHVTTILKEQPITSDELRLLLEGGQGACVIGKRMFEMAGAERRRVFCTGGQMFP